MKNRFYLLLAAFVLTFSSVVRATNHQITVTGSYPNFTYSVNGNAIDSVSPFSVNVGDSITWTQDFNLHPLASVSVPASASPFSNTYATMNFVSTFTYVVTTAGRYTFVCTFHGFTGAFVASIVNGVKQNNLRPVVISVYPSVTHDVVNLNIKDGFTSGRKLNAEVYNILGNHVINLDFLSNNPTQLNVADLSNGIYFVAIKENNTVLAVQKIIKQ